jgi:hypothetical protein
MYMIWNMKCLFSYITKKKFYIMDSRQVKYDSDGGLRAKNNEIPKLLDGRLDCI